jgi:hypothetical protein
MLTNSPKVAAVGAFLAGGALMGGLTLAAGSAHGAETTTTTTAGALTDAQYTAKHAWVQSIPDAGSGPQMTNLTIPAGDRLTISSAIAGQTNYTTQVCTLSATVNSQAVSYALESGPNGNYSAETPFVPIYADSGSITCNGNGASGVTLTLVGYVTPVPGA